TDISARSQSTDQSALSCATFLESSRTATWYFFISVRALRLRDKCGPPNRQFVCRRSTLAFAPRSTARSRPEDGNLSFMASIRPSGSFALLSSSSKATKYLAVKSTALLESRGAPTLLCPGTTTDGFNSLIFSNELNHFSLALPSVS